MYSLKAFARQKGNRKLKNEKLLEISITINVGWSNIFGKMSFIMEKFIDDLGVLGLCALERKGNFSKPHLQMVCKIYIFNVIVLNNLMKKTLG
jgi:hypothetical protein